jgi:hypothetical protein
MQRESESHFPGGKHERPLSNMALLVLLRRSRLTAHGFRSTFPDWAAERTTPLGLAEGSAASVGSQGKEVRRQAPNHTGGVASRSHDQRPGEEKLHDRPPRIVATRVLTRQAVRRSTDRKTLATDNVLNAESAAQPFALE